MSIVCYNIAAQTRSCQNQKSRQATGMSSVSDLWSRLSALSRPPHVLPPFTPPAPVVLPCFAASAVSGPCATKVVWLSPHASGFRKDGNALLRPNTTTYWPPRACQMFIPKWIATLIAVDIPGEKNHSTSHLHHMSALPRTGRQSADES